MGYELLDGPLIGVEHIGLAGTLKQKHCFV